MNHKKIHDQIIDRAKLRGLIKSNLPHKYFDCHHITPVCMGGTWEDDNLAFLSYKEHALVHLLLCYIYKDQYGLLLAYKFMSSSGKYSITEISRFKIELNKLHSKRMKVSNPSSSIESRKKAKEEQDMLPSYWDNGWCRCLILGIGTVLAQATNVTDFNILLQEFNLNPVTE